MFCIRDSLHVLHELANPCLWICSFRFFFCLFFPVPTWGLFIQLSKYCQQKSDLSPWKKEQCQSLCSDTPVCIGAGLHFAYKRARTDWVGTITSPGSDRLVWSFMRHSKILPPHGISFLKLQSANTQKWGKVLTKLFFFGLCLARKKY